MTFVVRDCMSGRIAILDPEMNAKEALKFLLDSGHSGLPVVDKDGRVLGVFTEKEVLGSILPTYVKHVGPFIYSDDSKAQLKRIAQLDRFLVKDIMRKEVSIVNEDASLTEVSRIMLTKSERRVVVVREDKIIGVLTRYDIVKALHEKSQSA